MQIKQSFSMDDEQKYRYSPKYVQINYLRTIYGVFIFLFAAFGLLDHVYFPDAWKTLFAIRFGIVVPAFIFVVALTYTKYFIKLHQVLISLSALIGGIAIAYMLVLQPDNIVYYGGLFMIYFTSYFILGLRYSYATIVGWSILSFHIVCYFLVHNVPTETFFYGSLFFIGANFIGMMGSYNFESLNRKQFLHDKEIDQINTELIVQCDEKANQLSQLEKSIEENQQLILINQEKDALTASLKESQEKYKFLITQMQLGLALHEVVFDDEGKAVDFKYLDINESYTKLLGITPEMCIGKNITDVVPLVGRIWIDKLCQVAMTGKSIYHEDYLDTTKKYYSSYSYSPQPGRFAVLINDITDRKNLEMELQNSNKRFMAIFEESPMPIEYYDKDGNMLNSNKACIDLFGVIEPKDLLKNNLFANPNLTQESRDKIANFEAVNVEIEFSFDKVREHKTYRTNKSGTIILFLSIVPITNDDNLSGYIVHTKDITIERQKQKEVEYISYHDFLTNAYNRRFFVRAYSDFIQSKQLPLGVMMIDINGLKIINDAYGHLQGDLSIKLVADLLKNVFGKDDVVARIGGDEFAVLLPQKNALQLQEYKEEIIEKLKGLTVGNIEISLAIGYEVVSEVGDSIDDILSTAEKFLYRHKLTVGSSIRNHAIKAILNTLTDKYIEEKIHSERVSRFCREIGIALGVNAEDVDVLELAGMYHDIGKISIPDAILYKPARLTDEEYEIIKTHTQNGYQILKAADEYSGLAEYALSHHERWDGKGYPKGLKGKKIPLYSRIINVADSFEAMTANRPYRNSMSIEEAVKEIKRCSGTQFDPEIAKVFIDLIEKNGSELGLTS